MPLRKAWAVHVLGGVMLVGVVGFLVVWSETRGDANIISLYESADEIYKMEIRGPMSDPREWFLLLFAVVMVEFGWWLSALIMMSWSARDEHFRLSHRRALRRLLVITPHLAMIVFVAGTLIVWADRKRWKYAEFFNQGDVIIMLCLIAACLWALAIVLRSVGCGMPKPYARWPALCSGCGYQLAGMRKDQDCPECGLAVKKTLDPSARPGIPAPRHLGGWLRRTYASVRCPSELGRTLHVLSPDTSHRRCLATTIAALMLTSPLAMSLVYVVVDTLESRTRGYSSTLDVEEMLFVGLVMGSWIGLSIIGTMIAVLLIGSGIIGLTEGWRVGRNLMPAAVRSASYLSGFTLAWAGVFWCNLLVFIVVMVLDLLSPISARHNIGLEEMIVGWHATVILTGIGIYLVLIGRATRAARYANW